MDIKTTLRRVEYKDDGNAEWQCLGCRDKFIAPDWCAYQDNEGLHGWRHCPLCGVKWSHVFFSINRWDSFDLYSTAKRVDWWWVIYYLTARGQWHPLMKFDGDTPAKLIKRELDRYKHYEARKGAPLKVGAVRGNPLSLRTVQHTRVYR